MYNWLPSSKVDLFSTGFASTITNVAEANDFMTEVQSKLSFQRLVCGVNVTKHCNNDVKAKYC